MTTIPPPNPTDPTLEVAERHLAILRELTQMGLALSRGYTAAGLAAANAVEVILADEYWQPETGRARALAGSTDAAEGFRKVSRSLRLTLAMEMSTAETVRDLRAGIIPARRKDAGETPALRLNQFGESSPPERRRSAGFDSNDEAPDVEFGDSERLYEFDRPDRLPRGTFHEIVDTLCVDIGVAPDWTNWRIGRPKLDFEPLKARPPGWSECRPPGSYPPPDEADDADVSTHPAP